VDELLTMSKREITRLEAMQRLTDKRLTQKDVAGLLEISVRQVKRLWRAYRQQGAKGLISARRGKPSNNRNKADVAQLALDLIQEKYSDFGPTLAHENLAKVHQLQLSCESVRRIMIEEGVWKPKRAKAPPIHQKRERQACFSELVQIDGSDYACQKKGTLTKNLTMQANKVVYQIQSDCPDCALRYAQVLASENAQGEVTILYKNQPLSYSIYQKPQRQAEIVKTKTLDHHIRPPHSPAPDHPWRQNFGRHLNGQPIQLPPSHGTG
jgi:transposase